MTRVTTISKNLAMELTLDQAATRLGKSVRQVRYMIKQGTLPARKRGKRWVVDDHALPTPPAQQKASERKQRQLRAAVERGLELPDAPRRPRYSVRDLRAIQIVLPLHERAESALGASHSVTGALRQVVEHLARGCHRYDYGEKAVAYSQARDAASQAVGEILLTRPAIADELIGAIEQELMAALAGLLRRLDRKRMS